jgi:hypothetical protein
MLPAANQKGETKAKYGVRSAYGRAAGIVHFSPQNQEECFPRGSGFQHQQNKNT